MNHTPTKYEYIVGETIKNIKYQISFQKQNNPKKVYIIKYPETIYKDKNFEMINRDIQKILTLYYGVKVENYTKENTEKIIGLKIQTI